MKKLLCKILFLVGCLVLSATALPAQDNTNAPGDVVTNATTNPQVLAEEPGKDSTSNASDQDDNEWRGRGLRQHALVVIGNDAELKAEDTAQAVVVIGGSAKVKGKVRDAVVTVFGGSEIDGEVREAVVSVFGDVKLGPNARVHGNVVAVGGKIDAAPGARIDGHSEPIDFPDWLKTWLVQCAIKMRPLAPQVGWVWLVAGAFFLIYVGMTALFPRPIQACSEELTRRPATTFLMGLLSQLLLPLVLAILAATGVGVLVVPFVFAAIILAGMVGKAAILQALGMRLGRQFGSNALQQPLLALLLGGILITACYMVPFFGLLVFGIVSVWGFGGAVTAAFGGLRKEIPEKRSVAVNAPMQPVPAMAGGGGGWEAGTGEGESTFSPGLSQSMPGGSTALPEVLAHPKAGFWERMGAAFLDIVLVSILGALVGGPPLAFLVALAYFGGMWGWKGTTIGGIVLGLKVVRPDGQPISFAVAIVRAFAAAFSIVVLFLGFLWIAWDRDKQGWHDKIAGTVVLRLPRGTPLVCL